MSELFAWAGLHPRALIRQAVCQVMREHAGLDALLAGRVWPNRMEHWFHNEFPAAGVYTLQEVRVASDVRPEPQERRLTLAVELLAGALESVDDTLDALCLQAERAVLRLDAIGRAMGGIVDALLPDPLPLIRGRHPADTLLSIVHTGSDLALAVEGQRQMGAAVLNLDLEYRWPVVPPELADLLLAHTDWYVHPGDDRVDMISQVTFDQERSDAPPHHHVHRARRT